MLNIDKITSIINEEEQFIISRESPCLLSGKSALALYYLQQYNLKKDFKYYIKYRSTIIDCVNKINSLFNEVSFFTGPLGILWVLILGSKNTKYMIYKASEIDSIINKYIMYHLKNISKNPPLLDYIYGYSSWFIIYPYLNPLNKKNLIKIFISSLNRFDGTRIYSRKVLDNKEVFPYKEDVLGFAHGFTSVLFVTDEYKLLHQNEINLNKAKVKLEQSINNLNKLARYFNSNDYIRQEWCHGNIGLLTINKELRANVLENYFSTSNQNCNLGMCHGEAHKILLHKIYKLIYKENENYQLNYSKKDFKTSNTNFNFFESAMIYQIATNYDLKRDSNFLWWRMFYPFNMESS